MTRFENLAERMKKYNQEAPSWNQYYIDYKNKKFYFCWSFTDLEEESYDQIEKTLNVCGY